MSSDHMANTSLRIWAIVVLTILCFSQAANLSNIGEEAPRSTSEADPEVEKGEPSHSNPPSQGFTAFGTGQEYHSIAFNLNLKKTELEFHPDHYRIILAGPDHRIRTLQVTFEGAALVRPIGMAPSPLTEQGPPTYQRLLYPQLYPGLDLMFYLGPEGLKYDVLVASGADPSQLRLTYDGHEQLYLDKEGDLHAVVEGVHWIEQRPYVYQNSQGEQVEVASDYVLQQDTLSYRLGAYDPRYELVIDPLLYSTYLGAQNYTTEDMWGFYSKTETQDIVVDEMGRAIVCGHSISDSYPTTPDAYDRTPNGDYDIILAMISKDGTELLYSTYLGGSKTDQCSGLALEPDGLVYLVGQTDSGDMPVTQEAYQGNLSGGFDVYLAVLNLSSSELVYGGYYGGEEYEEAAGISVDQLHRPIVTGTTNSSDLPTTSDAYAPAYLDESESTDCFLMRLTSNGADLDYGSYFGGNQTDTCSAQALGFDDSLFITGTTASENFPTSEGAFDDQHNGTTDAFGSRLQLDGEGEEGLLYSTFIGGDHEEEGMALAVNATLVAFYGGETRSEDFPVSESAYQKVLLGGKDLFVFQLNREGNVSEAGTFLGGTRTEKMEGLTLDREGDPWLGGAAFFDFNITSNAYDQSPTTTDAIVASLSANLSELNYGSYFGGWRSEHVTALTPDLSLDDTIYMTGYTGSVGFPASPGAFDLFGHGFTMSSDSFVARLNPSKETPRGIVRTIWPWLAVEGATVTLNATTDDPEAPHLYRWVSHRDGELYNGTKSTVEITSLTPGQHRIFLWVMDENETWSEASSAWVRINSPPTAVVDQVFPSPGLEGAPVTFVSKGYDPDGSVAYYRWRSSRDLIFTERATSWQNYSELSVGHHVIFHSVRDDLGCWSEEVRFELDIIERPRAHIILSGPSPVLDNHTITLWGDGLSPDRQVEAYRWSSDLSGELYNGSKGRWTLPGLSPGHHRISLEVKDQHGFWSLAVFTTIRVSSAPVANITQAPIAPHLRDEVLVLRGGGEDDGNLRRYSWSSDLQGELYNGGLARIRLYGLVEGTHVLTLKVEDDCGFWSEPVNMMLEVISRPLATISLVNPSPILLGEMVNLKASTEASSDIVTYRWKSDVQGQLYNGSQRQTNIELQTPGWHTLTLEVEDELGHWSLPVDFELLVVEPPTANIEFVPDETVASEDGVRLEAQAVSVSGFSRISWRSDLDGPLYMGAHHTVVLHDLSPGEHTLFLKVQDIYGHWSPEVSAPLSVTTRPRVEALGVEPTNPQEGEVLTILATAIDDGEVVQYQWHSDMDGLIHEGDQATITRANLTPGNHTIYLRVQDDLGFWSTESSLKVTVEKGRNPSGSEGKSEDDGLGFWVKILVTLLLTAGLALLGLFVYNTRTEDNEENWEE